MCTVRLQTENKLLKAEVDSLTQQNSQQQQGLSQVQELVAMLQESHRVMTSSLASTYLKLNTSNINITLILLNLDAHMQLTNAHMHTYTYLCNVYSYVHSY